MDDITGKALVKLKVGTTDDTTVHQMNRRYCMVFFIVLAIFSGSSQFVGEPISCWCPAQFEKFHVKYANAYCWIRNTYTVPFEESIPQDYSEREEEEVKYYQWVPLIFVFQALLFFIPRMFWKHWNGYSGLNLKKALILANDASLNSKDRDEMIDTLSDHLHKWIQIRDSTVSAHRKVTKVKEAFANGGFHLGNFMSVLYLMTDILYCANSVGQLFLLDLILGINFKTIGVEFYDYLFKNKKWEDNLRFPRVTFCDFDIRQLNNLQRWTVQCSLPINLFNEKMFVVVWFLLIIISLVNAIHLFYNFIVFFLPRKKMEYVEKYLTLSAPKYYTSNNKKAADVARRFVDLYLKNDGVFVIWLITQNTSSVIASEVVEKMWINYCELPSVQSFLLTDDDEYLK